MRFAPLAAFACAAFAAACVQLLPDPPQAPRLYPLEPAALAVANAQAEGRTVLVGVPSGPALALGEEIVWRSDGVLGVAAGAAWPDRADMLLQRILVQAFAEANGADSVLRRAGSVSADYEVQVDVARFEIVEAGGQAAAEFAAQAVLLDARTRRALATAAAEARTPLAARSASAAAHALQQSARDGAAALAARLPLPRSPSPRTERRDDVGG